MAVEFWAGPASVDVIGLIIVVFRGTAGILKIDQAVLVVVDAIRAGSGSRIRLIIVVSKGTAGILKIDQAVLVIVAAIRAGWT